MLLLAAPYPTQAGWRGDWRTWRSWPFLDRRRADKRSGAPLILDGRPQRRRQPVTTDDAVELVFEIRNVHGPRLMLAGGESKDGQRRPQRPTGHHRYCGRERYSDNPPG